MKNLYRIKNVKLNIWLNPHCLLCLDLGNLGEEGLDNFVKEVIIQSIFFLILNKKQKKKKLKKLNKKKAIMHFITCVRTFILFFRKTTSSIR